MTEPAYTTPDAVAVAVGITADGVRRMCRAGKLPGAVREGSRYRGEWRIPTRYLEPGAYREAVGRPGPTPKGDPD